MWTILQDKYVSHGTAAEGKRNGSAANGSAAKPAPANGGSTDKLKSLLGRFRWSGKDKSSNGSSSDTEGRR